jgi:uncharacterized protein
MTKRLRNESDEWALITGGSSGIGYEFARQLALDGYNLIIASRDDDKLAAAANELQKTFKVQVETMKVDLANKNQVDDIIGYIENLENRVQVVVNDAGFAVHESLLSKDDSHQLAAFAVMAEATLRISGAAARTMKTMGKGHIINVASTSAWLFAGNYSALKRWTVVYTESLALELKGSGVTATAVCPGWVKTDFHKNGGVSRPNVPDWIWIPVDVVVTSALSAAVKGKSRVVPTLRWKIAIFVVSHCECLTRIISRRLVAKRVAELDRQKRPQ